MFVCVYNYIIMCLGVLCCCTNKDVGVFSYIKVRLLFASKLAGVLWQSSLQRSLHTLFTFVRTGFALYLRCLMYFCSQLHWCIILWLCGHTMYSFCILNTLLASAMYST